jgi:hypothetical protein
MEAQEEELYVAVPEKSKEGTSLLRWVLRNAPKDVKIVITHVYIVDRLIPAPCKISFPFVVFMILSDLLIR